MSSSASSQDLKHQYSSVSKELTTALSKTDKKDNGIYFTPPSCVHHNIELLLPHLPKKAATNAKFRILEPSFGSGEYITALRARFPVSNITGVEKNRTIFDAVVQKYFPNTTPGITLLNADFLAYESGTLYNLIIGNPPYFVMKKEEVDVAYQQYYDGRPNIFILFIIKCLRMLADGGIMSFILPKSFLNCLYYDKTRKHINDKFEILDIVECSDDKYIETAQETVIIIIRKGAGAGAGARAVATIADVPFVMRGAYTIFNTKENISIFKRLYENSKTLADLRFKVSVGKVVWNQCKDILTDDESKTLLIYSSNITNNRLEIKTYKNGEKKNYIDKSGIRTPMIVLNRGYGTGEYKFSYCLIEGGGDGDRDYLVENHLICIECVDKIDNVDAIARYRKVMKSFADERTTEFIKVYFGNSAINTTELGNILPIYGDI
jgi:type I restriction-modification system DNA methylase subunit